MITVKEIFDNPITKEYIKVSREVAKYYKLGCCEPHEANTRYQKALYNYREYLDLYDVRMPKQIYKWDAKNRDTWKYKDVTFSSKNNGISYYKSSVLNEKWEGNK